MLENTLASGDVFAVDGNTINFTGPRTLGATTCTGTLVFGTPVTFDGTATIEDVTGASGFYAGPLLDWSGGSTLEDATQLGLYLFLAPANFSGDALLGAATASIAGYLLVDPDVGRFVGNCPTPTVRAYGGAHASATAPRVTSAASGTRREVSGAVITAPAATAIAYGGHQATATAPTVQGVATGTTVAMAQAIMLAPMPYVEATGRVSGQSTAQAYAPAAIAYAQGGHSAAATAPAATVTASVIGGGIGRGDVLLPMPTSTTSGFRTNAARGIAVAPMLIAMPSAKAVATAPSAQVFAFGGPVTAVTHEAYALNMNQPLDDNPRNNFESKNEQVTRYTAWPFTQVVRFGDSYFGVAADGLYEIGGQTNDGAPINWQFQTCITDFKDPNKKTVASVYVGGQAGPAVTYTLVSGDDPDRTYPYSTTKTVERRNHRQKFGLGRRARYYALGLAGGGDLAVDSIELELVGTTRRI